MKNFRDFLKEEVLPTAQVADGSLDIEKPAVRAAINAAIAGVISQPAVTPYVVFNRLSKLLAQYHIILPKRFLEGDKGVEVFEIRQFGHKMGMTDSGEFVNQVPSTHYLFLQYGIITPFGITYAKPVVGGMYKVMARLVDKEELDKLLDMAEITMAEEAEHMQAIAKANAPREEMHDVTSDEKKKGNKAAVADSEKGLKEASTEKLVRYRNKAGEGREKGAKLAYAKLTGKAKVKASAPKSAYMEEDKDPCWKGYEMIGMKKKGGKPVPNCVPKEETQIDELKKSTLASYIKKAHVSGLEAASQGEIAYANKDKAGLRAANKTGEKREQGIERAAGKLAKEEYEKVEAGVKKTSSGTHTLHRRNPGHKTEYHTITTDRDGRKSVKTGSPKYIKKHWDDLKEAFGVYRKGGSIGEKPSTDPVKSFDNEADAKSHAKGMNRQLSPGEKKYYRIKYHVKPIREEEQIAEKHLTSAESKKKEEIVKSMKKGLAGFKERYGKRAKAVMYATATKQAEKIAEKLEFDPSTEVPKNT